MHPSGIDPTYSRAQETHRRRLSRRGQRSAWGFCAVSGQQPSSAGLPAGSPRSLPPSPCAVFLGTIAPCSLSSMSAYLGVAAGVANANSNQAIGVLLRPARLCRHVELDHSAIRDGVSERVHHPLNHHSSCADKTLATT